MSTVNRQFVLSDFQLERHEESNKSRVLAIIGIARGFIRSGFADKVSEPAVERFLTSCDCWIEVNDVHNLDTYSNQLRDASEVLNAK